MICYFEEGLPQVQTDIKLGDRVINDYGALYEMCEIDGEIELQLLVPADVMWADEATWEKRSAEHNLYEPYQATGKIELLRSNPHIFNLYSKLAERHIKSPLVR